LADPTAVTLLYTANLRGDLAYLPRLATVIQRERRTAEGPTLLLDLGDTCSPDSWVCRATQGRAPFLVLDAMGYDAALIGGPEQAPIPPASLRRLMDQLVMAVIVWNRARPIVRSGITLTVAPGDAPLPETGPVICVDRGRDTLPADQVPAHDPVLTIGDAQKGQLARVDMAWPEWTLRAARLVTVAQTTPADPGIAAVAQLVEHEARRYAQEQGGA
jgi:hypothetical protein